MVGRAAYLFSSLMAVHAVASRRAWRCTAADEALFDAHSFDAHIFACALALAAEDAERDGVVLAERLGLGVPQVEAIIARYFSPEALGWLRVPVGSPAPDEEEGLLRNLLRMHRRLDDEAGAWLADVIARRAMCPNHLWQDLGLRTRAELSRLLAIHFGSLAAGNTTNMKWKKYFYRRLCEAEGFSLCTAPSCAECSDFEHCFGDESGESLLARRRRAGELVSS